MFSLRCLTLFFLSAQSAHQEDEAQSEGGSSGTERDDDEEEEGETERATEKKKKNKYDLMFERGDLLEVPRTLFAHFGIYLGEGRVAHLIPDILPVVSKDQWSINQMVSNSRLILGVLAKAASVRVDSVEDFAYGSDILVNKMDEVCKCPALRGDEVARRAERLQGAITYSLLWYNCEHYVMYCRYGTCMSFQTFQFCKSVRKLLLSRRLAKAEAMLAACLVVYYGAWSTGPVLLAIIVPFIMWMLS